MIKSFTCRRLSLGDRVSLQQMSKHLHLESSIGQNDFTLEGDTKSWSQLKKSRGWKQFVKNARVKAK